MIVPNSQILNSEIVNFSSLAQERGLILHTTVGIGYEMPWRQVEAMLLMAVDRTPGLLQDPPPFVLHRKLGDFAVDYEINAYCRNAREMLPIYTALHRNILDVFNEYGVQIMTPAYRGDHGTAQGRTEGAVVRAPSRARSDRAATPPSARTGADPRRARGTERR